ncbi:unnamed protein product, partial [Discosporangium mesarthrocarpum]
RWRGECQVDGCPFRHVDEGDRADCAMFTQGFCRLGPMCRFR